jgi:hypothetical protein
MEEEKKAVSGPNIKLVAIISGVIFGIAVISGFAMLALPLGGINSTVLMGPFNVIAVFPVFAVIFILAAVICVVAALNKPGFWWLMPVGTTILIIGWLASCKILLNLIEKGS